MAPKRRHTLPLIAMLAVPTLLLWSIPIVSGLALYHLVLKPGGSVAEYRAGIASAVHVSKDVYTPEFTGNKAVALGARQSHAMVDKYRSSDIHLALTVVAAEARDSVRPPLNVAIVVDQSGSMGGEKIAVARQSALSLVRELQTGDVVSVVTYDDNVDTLVAPTRISESTRSQVQHAISTIYPKGGTFISGGLERAAELVDAVKTSETINRVVLLSDGRATQGAARPDEFAVLASSMLERGIGISTVGMGLDYDEDIMQTIARSASGRYYFVANVSETETVFAEELSSLSGTVARRAKLEVRLPDGAKFVDAGGYYPQVIGDRVIFDLGALAGGSRTDILVELDVAARPHARQDEALQFETRVTYEDVQSPELVTLGEELSVTLGTDYVAVADVAERVQQIRTAKAFDDAMRLYDRGDRHGAAELLEQQRRANATFLTQNGLELPAFERVDEELEDLAAKLRQVQRQSSQGKFLSKSGKFRSANIVSNQVVF